MRKTRKILSLIMALSLLMSMFVVAFQQTASAAGGDGYVAVAFTASSYTVDISQSTTLTVEITVNKQAAVSFDGNNGSATCNSVSGSKTTTYTSTNTLMHKFTWDVG